MGPAWYRHLGLTHAKPPFAQCSPVQAAWSALTMVPAGQAEHDSAPAALYWPIRQGVHDEASAALWVPAAQAVHDGALAPL